MERPGRVVVINLALVVSGPRRLLSQQAAGVAEVANDEVIEMDGVPPMFFFADPDGNGLVYMEDT